MLHLFPTAACSRGQNSLPGDEKQPEAATKPNTKRTKKGHWKHIMNEFAAMCLFFDSVFLFQRPKEVEQEVSNINGSTYSLSLVIPDHLIADKINIILSAIHLSKCGDQFFGD